MIRACGAALVSDYQNSDISAITSTSAAAPMDRAVIVKLAKTAAFRAFFPPFPAGFDG